MKKNKQKYFLNIHLKLNHSLVLVQKKSWRLRGGGGWGGSSMVFNPLINDEMTRKNGVYPALEKHKQRIL